MNANLTLAHKFIAVSNRTEVLFKQALARHDMTAAQAHHHKLNRIYDVVKYLASRYDRSK